ncbi:MAG: hypothetical protein CL609_10290 [Anaerolineaceae bacterium]|nr:hypothetical protein [Anaerolineaceae bacterium]
MLIRNSLLVGIIFLIPLRIVPGYSASRNSFPYEDLRVRDLVDKDSYSAITAAQQQREVQLPDYSYPQTEILNGIRRLALLTTTKSKESLAVTLYKVQPGDNLFLIAEKFGLQPETVLWGNYETLYDNPQYLRPGQELNILPVDGVYYQWKQSDSLEFVADFFKVKPQDILFWPENNLFSFISEPALASIQEGTWLIIPGGRRALQDWGPPPISRSNPAVAAYYGSGSCGKVYQGAIGTGAFVWPTVARSLSGYDFSSLHPALDIAGAEGNAIYSTDSGVVVFAGWSEYGYGNLVVIDHGNGWQSAYAHMSIANVTCGQSVTQGKLIGAVGNTGNSTGAHLHFELRSEIYGKANPWDYISQ